MLKLTFNLDVLRSSCRKLQFLNINPEVLHIVEDEIPKSLSVETFHKKLKMEFQDLEPSATNEQILRYDNCWKDRLASFLYLLKMLLGHYSILMKILYANYRQYNLSKFLVLLFGNCVEPFLIDFCIMPYVYFCSYDIYEEDVENKQGNSNRDQKLPLLQRMVSALVRLLDWLLVRLSDDVVLALETTGEQSFLQKLAITIFGLRTQLTTLNIQLPSGPVYKKKSAFMKLALNQHENDLFSQEDTVLEVLLYFKWKKKIKYRFFLICFIHAVYYVSFSVGVLFSREVFDYSPGMPIVNNAKHIATVTLMLVSCGILWIQEARQFYKMGFGCWKYFFSFYNYVDLFALVLPIVDLWQMLTDKPGLVSV